MIAPLDELLHCLHGVFQSKPDTAMLYGAVQYGSRSVRPLGCRSGSTTVRLLDMHTCPRCANYEISRIPTYIG